MRAGAAALTSAAVLAALTGCSLEYRENVCSDGEYPVMPVGGTGGSCVGKDEEPPPGSVRYPEGKVPRQVDDRWDVYWRTHTLDTNGRITDAPDAG
ncbi:hypothetical protein GT039_04610 [Streptomyces sp. SID2955]|nr:hypothetical protein [Streptomyces sp. SID2955]